MSIMWGVGTEAGDELIVPHTHTHTQSAGSACARSLMQVTILGDIVGGLGGHSGGKAGEP